MLQDILAHNQAFVAKRQYEPFRTDKFPNKKLAIVTCMDTRLTELLPAALGIKNGDAKIIKNAGGVIAHPFGSVVRSLLIAIYELQVTDVLIVGHTDCGVQHMDAQKMMFEMQQRDISEKNLQMARYFAPDFDRWLSGFDHVEDAVSDSVALLRHHPLIPKDVSIHGFVMDSVTGELVPLSHHA